MRWKIIEQLHILSTSKESLVNDMDLKTPSNNFVQNCGIFYCNKNKRIIFIKRQWQHYYIEGM